MCITVYIASKKLSEVNVNLCDVNSLPAELTVNVSKMGVCERFCQKTEKQQTCCCLTASVSDSSGHFHQDVRLCREAAFR